MKMWILIHGAACMSLTGDYDLTDVQTMGLLENTYQAFAGVTDQADKKGQRLNQAAKW